MSRSFRRWRALFLTIQPNREFADKRLLSGKVQSRLLISSCFAIVTLVGTLLNGTASAGEPGATPAIDRGRLETFVDGFVKDAMRQDQIAGASVAIVDRSGPLLIKGYGLAAPGRAVDANTLFPVQSISKTMVWIALMQLVEQGRIHLDDPINAYLPAELRIPDEGFHKPILIRNLMSHTTGFEDSGLGHLLVDRPERLMPLDRYMARYRVHRVREPGSVVVYSNYGATLGGVIVAHVSGMPWEDYVERRIIRPLSMVQATFRQPYSPAIARVYGLPAPMPPDVAARMTEGFRAVAGRLEAGPREFTADTPAGALSSSATDMATYMRMLLAPQLMARSGVLKAQTLLDMRTPLFKGAAGFGDMRHGFQAAAMPGDLDAFGHGGDSVYQVADMTLIPGPGLGIFISTNANGGHKLVRRLSQAVVSEFLGGSLAAPVYGPTAISEAREYAGTYKNLRRAYFRTEHGMHDLMIDTASVTAAANGDLLLNPAFGEPTRLVPLGHGVYRDAAGPDRIAFRPLDGATALYDPYNETAWERVGYFEGAEWAKLIIALTALASFLVVIGGVRRIVARTSETSFERFAATVVDASAVAWLAGFGLFAAFIGRALSGAVLAESMFWYPSQALILACWAFAAAAALTVASLPGLVAVARTKNWSVLRKARHLFTLIVFVACAATFWHLGFLGFSGW